MKTAKKKYVIVLAAISIALILSMALSACSAPAGSSDRSSIVSTVNNEPTLLAPVYTPTSEVVQEPTVLFNNPTETVVSGNEDITEGTDFPYDGYSFGAIVPDDEVYLVLPIGATEEQLRESLSVIVTLGEDEYAYTDYEIIGFDSSCAHINVITVRVAPGCESEMEVVICDVDNIRETSVSIDDATLIALGDTVGSVQDAIVGSVIVTDGTVEWEKLALGGFTIQSITDPSGEPIAVSEETTFDVTGTYMLGLSYNGMECDAEAYVYDPDNLIITGFGSEFGLWIYSDATEEDIRLGLHLSVSYDDGSTEEVEDFTFGDIEYNEEEGYYFITAYWNDLSTEVPVYFIDDNYPDPDDGNNDPSSIKFDYAKLIKYARFIDKDNDCLLLSALKTFSYLRSVYPESKALLNDAISIEIGEDDASIRIIINTEDDRDLCALLNLYFGIPTEEDWTDIDEDYIIAAIQDYYADMDDFDIMENIKSMTGIDLYDALSTIILNCDLISIGEESLSVSIELSDGGENTYLLTGFDLFLEDEDPQFSLYDTFIGTYQLDLSSIVKGFQK